MIYLCRELTVNNPIYIVKKLIIFQVLFFNGYLKVASYLQGGICVVIHSYKNMNTSVELHIGGGFVETDPGDVEADRKLDNETALANEIWNSQCPCFNSISLYN